MVRRKVQRLEIVVVGFDNWSLRHGIAESLKNRNNLISGLDNRVFRPNRTPNAGQRDVDRFRGEGIRSSGRNVRSLDQLRNPRLQLIDTNAGLALGFFRGTL